MISRTYASLSRMIFLATLPMALFLIFFSGPVIRVFFGGDFVTGSVSLVVLAAGSLVAIALGPANNALQMFGKTSYLLFVQVGVMVLNIVLNALLIPVIGISGAAIATAFTTCISAVLLYIGVLRIVPLALGAVSYLKYLVSGLVAASAALLVFRLVGVVRLWVLVAVGVLFILIYFGLLVIFRAFSSDDAAIMRAVEEKIGLKRRIISRFLR